MNRLPSNIKKIAESIEKDRVFLYAAQASYYVIFSMIPFLCLLISVLSFFIPVDIYSVFAAYEFPQEMEDIFFNILDQLFATQNVSLMSISAVFALWAASRGADSIRVGLERVYHEKRSKGFLQHQLKSLTSTIVLILVMVVNIIFTLFGKVIAEMLHLSNIYIVIRYLSIPILFLLMALAFALMYAFVGKIDKPTWKGRFRQHLPGAFFASAGWILVSYGGALFIRIFPRASVIYGTFTAISIVMLWVNACIVIMFIGAEINKLIMREKGSFKRIRRARKNETEEE